MASVTSVLAVILQRRLAVRDMVVPLCVCEQIVGEIFEGAAAIADAGLSVRRGVRLVETDREPI